MEDDLKISKVEYLSNHLFDHTKILKLSLEDQTIFYKYFKWRQPQNSKSGISQQQLIGSCSNFKLKLRWLNNIWQMKTTSNGRWPQNIKNQIVQQPLIGSYSNFKLKLIWPKYFIDP